MANDVVTLFLALVARCTLSPLSSPTLQACAKLYESYSPRWSLGALLEKDFSTAWKVMDEWWVWWNALPARLAAHGQDLEDYILAYNAQDATELATDLEAKFNFLMGMSSCNIIRGSGTTYPDPAQLESAFDATTPGHASTTRQIAQKAASACQTLQAKLDGLVSSAEKGQLARRGGTALYKGLKCATCVVAGLRTALAIAHYILLSTPSQSPANPIPPVVLTKLNSLLERANARIITKEWGSVIETWTEMFKVANMHIKATT
jgi:hypothetical protein